MSLDTRKFKIEQSVRVDAGGERLELWLPLPAKTNYQKVSNLRFSNGKVYNLKNNSGTYLYSQCEEVHLSFEVEVSERTRTANQTLSEDELTLYLSSNSRVPTDGVVAQLASQITEDVPSSDLERARAIYNWIVEHSERDPDQIGCGLGNVKDALESKHICGRCADISSVVAALMRASGIPCREVFGLRVGRSTIAPCLGKIGDVSMGQHCRNEFFIRELGWVGCDAGDVSKLLLEENLKLPDPRAQKIKDKFFSYWEPNWLAYNWARDFDLEPSTGISENYLMYPIALILGERKNPYLPEDFFYKIESR